MGAEFSPRTRNVLDALRWGLFLKPDKKLRDIERNFRSNFGKKYDEIKSKKYQ